MAVLKDKLQEAAAIIAKLQAENDALKANKTVAGISIGVDDHGNKVLNFTGDFRPFAFTAQKCTKLVPFLKNIEAFANSKGTKM